MFKEFFRTNTELKKELKELSKKLSSYEIGWPPGHFYSPVPDLDYVKNREQEIWKDGIFNIPGIDLNEREQLAVLELLANHYTLHPWKDNKQKGLRYYFQNPNFSYGESIILFCMLMHLKPKQVIEIGSGYSSCVLLDANEKFFQNTISTIFIEPYNQLLFSLIHPSDQDSIKLIPTNLQEAGTDMFKNLEAGDFLIIDSTHVSKIDSDVNHILFTILPGLKSGVYIHFHDIWFPFEYPKEWIFKGRAWNELYILRAFLQYNTEFEIIYFNSMMGAKHREVLEEKLPLCAKNPGTSFWIKKK